MQHPGAGLQVLYGLFRSLSPPGAAKIVPNPHSRDTEPLIVTLVLKSSSYILYEGGEYLSVDIHWGFPICCQIMVISLFFVLMTWLFWAWLPFLTINRLLQGLAVSLSALKLFKFHSVLRYRRLLGPLYYFIYFCLNKSLVSLSIPTKTQIWLKCYLHNFANWVLLLLSATWFHADFFSHSCTHLTTLLSCSPACFLSGFITPGGQGSICPSRTALKVKPNSFL